MLSRNVLTPVDQAKYNATWDGLEDIDSSTQTDDISLSAPGAHEKKGAESTSKPQPKPKPGGPEKLPATRKITVEEAEAWANAELARLKEANEATYTPAVQGTIDRVGMAQSTIPSAPRDPFEGLEDDDSLSGKKGFRYGRR